ncbi:TetR/AcrR family transcriptional regulator [Slackia heliotrinireducens]|jgi:AcrR family transcriptional regulator|uniref:Transcriptional regulator n=1 Tax=Slackia heliotrinireducens (strain ATCC 29202 / DSM 20476 / NCTC 11029 / RHS 1) TaxID=471855 RepID=C7N1X6_SLAHD|nr:TetR/AcrR family transcriptional regulator [Slackia heliotrinireducens]ACV23417.1 transcriptional regulator [Slackia heliotrinireducens DSM 20476]VEH02718.1 Potential acrAB operon repressor [Slackia heliotrinireducens]
MTETTATQQAILDSARRHFSEKGFRGASLNQIVKDAGFTKGAFYGYYASKEELFHALVSDTFEGMSRILGSMTAQWQSYPDEERVGQLPEAYLDHLPELVDFFFEHRDDMRLILTRSEGTRYENFLQDFSGRNIARIGEVLERAHLEGCIDPDVFGMVMGSYYSMLAQIVVSDCPREEVYSKMRDVQTVFQHGLLALLDSGNHGGEMHA